MAATDPLFLDIPFAPEPHRLAYHRWGDENSEHTVLCVHGLSRNSRDFDFLAEALAERYHVIAPDMPGRGDSDWFMHPANYNYQTYLTDLQYLLHALEISRVHWIGTSMGGILGMMMAGARPGLIESLLLNDVGCIVAKEGLKRILSYVGIKMQFDSLPEAQAALRTVCAPFGIREEKHWQHLFTHSIRQAQNGSAHFTYDPMIAAAILSVPDIGLVQDVNLWPLWEAVKPIPTLVIRGAESDILRKQTALEMQAAHPNLTLHEVPATGHAPALMDAGEIEFIQRWLIER